MYLYWRCHTADGHYTDGMSIRTKTSRLLQEFKTFAARGNVIDLAVGVMIGAAFNSIVQSLVNDIIMPPIGLLLGKIDLSSLFIDLTGGGYKTWGEAKIANAPTINYGMFLNHLINFIIVAFVAFLIVKEINHMKNRMGKQTDTSKQCKYCLSTVSKLATRCPQCTSHLTPAGG